MKAARIRTEQLVIPTYPEPPREPLPVFAENRVHQRSTGRPYPNKVVLEVNRTAREDRTYTAVHLENEYLDVWVLPEIGGRIFAAQDKTTGYDFFYRQHVIKPALIGALGSWISGGVEFNWPYHHRPSGFMPCDFTTEETGDGSVICWISEHDPIDRMKSQVGIVLKSGSAYLETRVRLCNRTPLQKSFLWWENAAVPVNETYQIFFPHDVTYVNFHYLDSRITYPVASDGVYNGFDMTEPRDISWHKNTRDATSYFACASRYDFFGGYDHGRNCGVVHIGNHHISPGKKMFTWAYGQLARSWERALTDADGPYAELMAGSYTDNQPDFSWLEPYETKEFSQYWYPISRIGPPDFANRNLALRLAPDQAAIQSVEDFGLCRIVVREGSRLLLDTKAALIPGKPVFLPLAHPDAELTISVADEAGRQLAFYQEESPDILKMPPVKDPMPPANEMQSADELYLAGVHVEQYRDPAVMPDAFWEEALKRNPRHIPSRLGLARYNLHMLRLPEALEHAKQALRALTRFNARPESGDAFYLYGLILEATGREEDAYDAFYQASWNGSAAGKAMTRLAFLDLKSGDWETAVQHALEAIRHDSRNPLAHAALIVALRETGQIKEAEETAVACLRQDPLNLLLRFLSGEDLKTLYGRMHSSPAQSVLDMVSDLDAMGQIKYIRLLLESFLAIRPEEVTAMLLYALAYYQDSAGSFAAASLLRQAETAELGNTYPFRPLEARILRFAADQNLPRAHFLLGCLLYDKRHYEEAACHFSAAASGAPDDYMARRCLAVACFSHLDRKSEALPLMKEAMVLFRCPQLLYETVVLMDKLGSSPAEKLKLLTENQDLVVRDDLYTELAKACSQNRQPEKALEVLLGRTFVPCEGGEHAIADQYMFAHYLLGMKEKECGRPEAAVMHFSEAMELPETLGVGIWNRCKHVPYQYQLAECQMELGNLPEAEDLYRGILNVKEDFFTNMHLPELPWYQAMSALRLGLPERSRTIMNTAGRRWAAELKKTDSGFFSTTPFFLSFVDRPADMRRSQYLYLTALVKRYLGQEEAARAMFEEAARLNSDMMFCGFFAAPFR